MENLHVYDSTPEGTHFGVNELGVTKCVRFINILDTVLFLQVTNDFTMPSDPDETRALVLQYIPALAKVSDSLTIGSEILFRAVCPVVSYGLDDVPPSSLLSDTKYFTGSKIHLSESTPNMIRVISVAYRKTKSHHKDLMCLGEMTFTKINHAHPPTPHFLTIWSQKLTVQELCCMRHKIPHFGWISYPSDSQEVNSAFKESALKDEIVVDISKVLVPSAPRPPPPNLNTVFVDCSYHTSYSKRDYTISFKQKESQSQVIYTAEGCQTLDLFYKHLNDYITVNDVHILVVYRREWVEKKHGTKWHMNRMIRSQDRGGILVVDASKYLDDDDYFPQNRNNSLAYMATKYLGHPSRARLTDPFERLGVIESLFDLANIVPSVIALSKICHCPVAVALSASKSIIGRWLVTHSFHEGNYIIRHNKTVAHKKEVVPTTDSEQHGGAIIPIDKFNESHSSVAVMDYSSDYPNIIRACNLCFSTLTASSLRSFATDNMDLKFFNMEFKEVGILGRICEKLYNSRQADKRALEAESDPSMKRQLTISCKTKKLAINCIYGCLSLPTWRYYCPAMAEMVTFIGRSKLKRTKEIIEKEFLGRCRVLCGVTDSLFIKFSPSMRSCCHQITDLINSQFPGCHFELEKVLTCYFPMRTNQYFGLPESPDAPMDWKGLRKVLIAPFVVRLRSEIIFQLAVMLSECTTTNTRHKVLVAVAAQVSSKLVVLIDAIKTGMIPPSEFVIAGSFSEDLHNIPLQESSDIVRTARFSQNLLFNDNPEGEMHFKNETVEMIMCHDPASTDRQSFFPAYLVLENLEMFDIHYEWYLSCHMIEQLNSMFRDLNIIDCVQLRNIIKKMK